MIICSIRHVHSIASESLGLKKEIEPNTHLIWNVKCGLRWKAQTVCGKKSLGNDTLYKLFREDKVHHVFLHSRTIREWKQDDWVTIHILLNRPCCGYISLTLISVLFQSRFGYSRISSDKKYMSNVHSRPVVSDD